MGEGVVWFFVIPRCHVYKRVCFRRPLAAHRFEAAALNLRPCRESAGIKETTW